MSKKSKCIESLWSNYWEYECEIRQYCFGVDPSRVLDKIDTDILIEPGERASILRLLNFDPDSATVWIGVSKERITLMGNRYSAKLIFAGEDTKPHSRFAVIDGFEN